VERFTVHSRLTPRDLHEILVVWEGGEVETCGPSTTPTTSRATASSPLLGGGGSTASPSTSAATIRSPPANAALARELSAHGTRISYHLDAGGHGGWRKTMPRSLRFYSRACA
jgi:hypothetical protein